MTDPPTLFLNTSQVGPTWTNDGLTLALNLGSTHGANVSCPGQNIYETQTFAGSNEATAGALFAPVVDQGHAQSHCTTPVCVALGSGSSNWTQATSLSESGISTGIGSAAITSDCSSLASSVASSVAPITSVAGLADPKARPSFRPIAMKKDVSGTPCQVAEITTSSLFNKNGDLLSPSNTVGGSVTTSLGGKSNMVTVVAASSATATSTTPAISSNGTSTGTGLVPSSSFANTLAASTSITLSSAGIPVGIAIARQRYVANSETVVNKQTTTPFKDAGNASCSTAAVVAPSSSASYSSVIPCHSTILSSGFATAPLGVIAESLNCPTKHTNEMAPTMTNLQPFWSTQTGGISGTATLPISIAQPQQTQTQPSAISIPTQTQQSAQTLTAQSSLAMPHQHAAVSQWHSYTGAALESQIATGVPSTCGGFQIARDSVSGQIILIPTGQIDSSVRQRNVFLVPSGGVQQSTATATAAAACSSTNHHQQTQQSFFISQQQQTPSPSYSIVLDHLVTATSALPAGIVKQKPAIPSATAAVVKLDNGLLTTGVMMPCGLAKSSPLQHNSASAAIGQQLISANNSSFSLVQQLTSSNVHNSNVNIPHHFSTISSSGSLVIQQISGNTVPSPLLNHVNNSLLISAEAAATQSILNAQAPQYVPNNASFLFNAQQLTSSTSSSSTLSSVPDNVVSSYADGSTPSSTSFIISTSCANRNDLGAGISLATSGPSIIPIDSSNTSSAPFKIANSVAAPTTVIATTAAASCTSTSTSSLAMTDDNDVTTKCHIYAKSSTSLMTDDPQQQQITLFKATEEPWSVQDAGNQTETNEVDPDGCSYDSDKKSVESDSSEESTRLKIDADHEVSSSDDDVEDPKEDCPPVLKAAETPDFSGLQLLLNGIEQVEHVRETGSEASTAICAPLSVTGSEEDGIIETKPISTQPANGLEILCALADQRFYEEAEDDKEGCFKSSGGAAKKRSAKQSIHDASDDDKISSYRYKVDDSQLLKSSRLFDSKHDRSVSPYEGNQLKMRLELARLQKKYRETRKVLDRLTHGKYASTVSSSSTRSPTPLKDVALTTGSSEPDCDFKAIVTPVKRRPGRPRKYSDPSLAQDKSNLSSSSSTSLPRSTAAPTFKSSLRPKPKMKFESVQDSSPEKTTGCGDLSPPVLEPMCSSSPKITKPFKSAVLSPPTLLPSKKSKRLQSPSFYLRTKRSYASRDGLDGFSSSDAEENYEDEIDSEEEDYERTKRGAIYGNDAFKVRKNFYKSGYLEENGKEMIAGLKRPLPEKRKVGRPRKYPKVEPQNQTSAETISCKNQNKGTSRFLTGVSKFSKYISSAMLESQRKPIHSSQYYDKESKPKITPKLKAEAKLKTWRHESPSPEANSPNDSIDCPFIFTSSTVQKNSNETVKTSKSASASDDDDEADYHVSRTATLRPSFTSISSKGFASTNSKFVSNSASTTASAVSSTTKAVAAAVTTTTTINGGTRDSSNDDFRITAKLLEDVEANPLRVLIAVGGLFRAGELSAVRAPDLYGIKLDGERGHRTHIYTKEEVLRDVVLEVEGKYPLKNGTRVCAFWSSQYLSLYPGYVTSFSSSDESEDEYFTSVEFDDGDSGRINIKDIRLLPKNFSISRRTPDDLKTQSQYHNHDHHKRKRRISGVSFEEIPVDKQLHSPKSPSLSPEETAQDDESSESRRISVGSSARKSFTEYEDTGSRSSSFDQNEPESRSNFEPSTTSGDEVTATQLHRRVEDGQDGQCRVDSKNTPQKKHLKKKRKDKLRAKDSASSSFKRKSHKCSDNDHDPDSRKLHKRHKHKHKHRKHHKRKRSSSSERKYTSEDFSGRLSKQSSDDRETNVPDDSEISCSRNDCSKEFCCNKNNNNNNSSKIGTCACKTKRNSNEKQPEMSLEPSKDQLVKADQSDITDRVTSTVKKEENHQQIEQSSKYGASNSVNQKQSKPQDEDDNKALNAAKKQPSGAESKTPSRKTIRPQSTATIQPATATASATLKHSLKKTTVEEVKKEEKQKNEAEAECVNNEEKEKASSEDSQDNQDEANSGDNFWEWCGKGFKRNGKGRAKKEFFQAIKRGDVEIRVGDCAVFLTADNSPKPFIGRIKSMWESYGNMMVLVKWFYHPEETSGLKEKLPFLGGLFESPHDDKNDVQTISHKCEVVSIKEYRERLKKQPERLHNVYESNDVYYLAGHYDPTNKRLTLEKDVVS